MTFYPFTPALATPESLYLAPAGATAETFPRQYAQAYFSGLSSEQVYMAAIVLPQNETVSNITLQVGGSAFTLADVSHGWYALCNSSRVVLAVSADQTSGNWGSTFTAVTLPMAAPVTLTYTGLYYIALCITFTSTSGEFPALPATLGNITNNAPILQGTSSAGQTTPPAAGATLGTITSVAADRFYAYTS